MDDIIIVGAGIGGLTLGLALHAAKIPCRIFESAAEIKPIGVGINLLPHATNELATLGLEQALARVAIATEDATFFNRFGQLIYQEPLGRAAGYDHPQFSIHPGDLQMGLLDAFRARAGDNRLITNIIASGLNRMNPASASIFPMGREVQTAVPYAAGSRSPATASTPRSASSFSPAKANRAIPASTCGAA